MNIKDYIRKYGSYSFSIKPFNEVDSLILAELSYVNLYLCNKFPESSFSIKDIPIHLLNDKKVYEHSVDAKRNKVMLNLMFNSIRYKDIIIKDIKEVFDKERITQFMAVTLILPNNTMYISFRGTDTSLLGWREDFLMLIKETIPSQDLALEYTLKALKENDCNFILGGHSKGGNLAFYSAFMLPKEYHSRLIAAHSFDGPGFRKGLDQFENKDLVMDKLTKYRTHRDFVGFFLNNMESYKVVASNGILLGGHDPFAWKVDNKGESFVYKSAITKGAYKTANKYIKWLDTLSNDDIALAIDAFYSIFYKCDEIYDLFRNVVPRVIRRKKALKKYSDEERIKIKKIYGRLFKFLRSNRNIDKYFKLIDKKSKNKDDDTSIKEVKENK